MKLSIVSVLILISVTLVTAFSFGIDIEKQLFNIAIIEVQPTHDTKIILPKEIPKVVYLSHKDLLNTFESIAHIISSDSIRGFCNPESLDKIYVDKDLDIFLLHSTILHEFVHILQFLNPTGACLIVEKQGGPSKCDEEKLSDCMFYIEMQAYMVEDDYKSSAGYHLVIG